jgi:branched-chain amino acid transport system substrate-binding protein
VRLCRNAGRDVALVALVAMLGISVVACSSSSKSSSGSKTTSGGSNNSSASAQFSKPSGTVRGFDGTTIKVASLGIKGQLPGVEFGASGRVKRFNDTNEIPGVKLQYVEFADDKNDRATALSEARRLVAQQQAFAIVGDTSAFNPLAYFQQQKVPYFGWGFDGTYCSPQPSTSLWGFGMNGCLIPDNPTAMPDGASSLYKYVAQKTGKQHPTVALFGGDVPSGNKAVTTSAVDWKGAGFDVVFAKGIIPGPAPVSDYTPYVQQLLTSNHGNPPDAMTCLAATDCIPMYKGLTGNNYSGIFISPLYSDLLLSAMKGSVVFTMFAPNDQPTPANKQVLSDIKSVKADQTLDLGAAAGYFTTDMFIQALKKVVDANGKAYISPDNVQKAAANMTWQIKGLMGPTKYPESTVRSTPACSAVVVDDGTQWKTVVPYSCSYKTWPVNG